MRKFITILCITVIAMFLFILSFVGISLACYDSKLNTAEANARQDKSRFFNRTIFFEFMDGSVKVPMTEVGVYTYNITMPVWYKALLDVPVTTVTSDWNPDALYKTISAMYTPGTDAKLLYTKDGWELIPENYNRDFDVDEVYSEVLAYHPEDVKSVNLRSLTNAPKVTAESLFEQYQQRQTYNDFHITYTCGIDINRDVLFEDEKSTPWDMDSIDIDWLENKLREVYDTTNHTLQFTTTDGEKVELPYKTYGVSVDWKNEAKVVKKLISECASEYSRVPKQVGYDSITDTYIEISIDQQHLWFYKDGQLVSETDIVTGLKNRRDTPTGVFYISERIPGKYLRGADYTTWVNQWMRLTNSGVGLHDAYWRSTFGKNIYEYDGSHGCINLPKDYAKKLYGLVETGYPVIIY